MPGLVRAVGRTAVVAGTATAVSNRVSRRQAGRWASQEQQTYQEPVYAQPQTVAPPPPEDPVAKLKQLAELKAQGILTQEEFDAQKQKILAST